MVSEPESRNFRAEADAQKRRVMRAVKMLAITWPLGVILLVFVRYAEEGATLTEIAMLVMLGSFLVGIWSIFSFFHERRVYRDQYGYLLDEAEDRE